MSHWRRAFALVALTGCAATTYDSSATTAEHAVTATTSPLSSDPAEMLPLMLDEVEELSRRVADGDGDGDAASRIEQMWAAIESTVDSERPELVSGFDFVVRRCRAAADRNRPADADRAFRNLQSLVDAYLAYSRKVRGN